MGFPKDFPHPETLPDKPVYSENEKRWTVDTAIPKNGESGFKVKLSKGAGLIDHILVFGPSGIATKYKLSRAGHPPCLMKWAVGPMGVYRWVPAPGGEIIVKKNEVLGVEVERFGRAKATAEPLRAGAIRIQGTYL